MKKCTLLTEFKKGLQKAYYNLNQYINTTTTNEYKNEQGSFYETSSHHMHCDNAKSSMVSAKLYNFMQKNVRETEMVFANWKKLVLKMKSMSNLVSIWF